MVFIKNYVAACCRGAAQVMLQSQALAGVFFLAGILAGGWHVFVFGVMALMTISLVCCQRGGFADGLWGFNALLVGCAASVFPCPSVLMPIVAAILTIPLKYCLDKLFARFGISSLTLPFILSTWAYMVVAHLWGDVEPDAYVVTADSLIGDVPDIVMGLLKGLSQVFLVDSWVGGALILVGLTESGWRVAAWAVAGSAAGMACATLCGCEWLDIVNGLWGYSPALTAIAVGVTFSRGIGVTLLAILLTFAIQFAVTPLLAPIGMPVLTLPFCVATVAASTFSREC